MSVDLVALKDANSRRWKAARALRDFVPAAGRLVSPSAKTQYQAVERRTSVPWFFIAVVHERESSQNWAGSLAQGDPWNKVSVHVPIGRGPFASWADAAVDALESCPPYAGRNHDWSVGGILTMLEQYNGLGYAMRGLPSPYVWSGTDQYSRGKFVRDGFYDPNKVDTQLGCAGLLMAMRALDHDVATRLGGQPAAPAPAGAFSRFLSAIGSFFGGRKA